MFEVFYRRFYASIIEIDSLHYSRYLEAKLEKLYLQWIRLSS